MKSNKFALAIAFSTSLAVAPAFAQQGFNPSLFQQFGPRYSLLPPPGAPTTQTVIPPVVTHPVVPPIIPPIVDHDQHRDHHGHDFDFHKQMGGFNGYHH